jgi:hypothetical protein
MRFDAYGSRTAVSGPDGTHPTASQFPGGTGYEREPSSSELGLDYLYQRYYDPGGALWALAGSSRRILSASRAG